MTRILFSSDWHLDAVTAGRERFAELQDLVDRIVRTLRDESKEIDHFVFCGDAFDPGHAHEARWHQALIEAAERISVATRGSSLWIAGNHDAIDRWPVLTTLTPLRCAVAWGNRRVRVAEIPMFTKMEVPDDPSRTVDVLALPYVSRAVEAMPEDRRGIGTEAFIREVGSVLGGRDGVVPPLVVVGHLSLPDMHASSEGDMVRGRDVMFPIDAVRALNPMLVVNGHYHRPAVVERGGLRIHIPGAPIRMTFGEIDPDPRGFMVAEV